MEYSEILNFIQSLPGWTWLIAGFTLLILTGDKKLWEYEVKFPMKQGVGRGEIELECLKKKGAHIEVALNLDNSQANKQIDIYLNKRHIYTVSAENNTTNKRIYINEKVNIEKPKEADVVTVNIDGQAAFEGQLVLD